MPLTLASKFGGHLSAMAAVALTLALAGCATPLPPLQPQVGRTTEQPNAIEVSVLTRTMLIHFYPGASTSRPDQLDQLNGLVAAGNVGPGDRIVIERGAGPLADVRARNLAATLSRDGLRPEIVTSATTPEGALRLTIDHAIATVRGCPNWSDPLGTPTNNHIHSDFGCATMENLASMIDDPRDLLAGRSLSPLLADSALTEVHRYHGGLEPQVKGLTDVSTTSGTGSQ